MKGRLTKEINKCNDKTTYFKGNSCDGADKPEESDVEHNYNMKGDRGKQEDYEVGSVTADTAEDVLDKQEDYEVDSGTADTEKDVPTADTAGDTDDDSLDEADKQEDWTGAIKHVPQDDYEHHCTLHKTQKFLNLLLSLLTNSEERQDLKGLILNLGANDCKENQE